MYRLLIVVVLSLILPLIISAQDFPERDANFGGIGFSYDSIWG